jgi:predicted ATPase
MYRCSDFRPSEVAAPQPSTASSGRLGPLGLDLVHVLRGLEQSADGLDAWKDRVAELIPDVKRVWTADSGGTHRWVMLKIGAQSWPLAQMSDGTVQALLLACLLFAPSGLTTLCIDEPELNLHPAWLNVLGGWFQRATSCEQVVLGTHSPDLLDTFTEGFHSGDVAVLVFRGDGKPVRRVTPAEVEPLLSEGWKLGDLYRGGEPALGGWPW